MNDEYFEFFEKQKKGTATMDDIPLAKKLNNNDEITEKDMVSYLLMLSMGIIE